MPSTTLFPSIIPDQDSADQDADAVLESGECPWCDDYSGDNPGQHAARAHDEAWAEYKQEA